MNTTFSSSEQNKSLSDSDLAIYEHLCTAWNTLQTDVLAPYLADDLYYDSLYWDNPLIGKDAYLDYLAEKFQTLKHAPVETRVTIEDENGVKKPYLRQGDVEAVFDMIIANGKITHMLIRVPNTRFVIDNFDRDFPELVAIARKSLTDYFSQEGLKPCGWLQTKPQEIRFQDLCMVYDKYVLCIAVALYFKTLEYGQQMYANPQEIEHLLGECEAQHMTPCLFLIDASGHPFNRGCHLVDARTFRPLNLDQLKEDNDGVMSDWELNNLGVSTVCSFLEQSGYNDICSCDVLAIQPQIFFKDHGQQSYAIIRSIPAGRTDQKIFIERKKLERMHMCKGYFVDVRWSLVKGGSGLGNEKQLYRGAQIADRSGRSNLMYNKIDLVDINEAIEKYDFIEVTD